MLKRNEMQVRLLTRGMDFLENHPLLVKRLLRPPANAPVLAGRLKVPPPGLHGGHRVRDP